MSSEISGDASAVSTSLTRTITDATNASPIVVTTSTSHLYSTGDQVVISGVVGNTAANSVWLIDVVDASRFSLRSSVGSGAYVSGGTAVDKSFTPAFQVPSDGDGPGIKAADLLPALETLADRTQHLAQLAGRSRTIVTFTASGTFHCPADVDYVFVEALGGGGGGGGGGSQASGDTGGCGGGGGGSAQIAQGTTILFGEGDYTITIGAGGAGGAGGVNTAGASGAAGGHTTINDGISDIVTARGAAGGVGGAIGNGTTRKLVNGGASNRDVPGGTLNTLVDVATGLATGPYQPGQGGIGYNYPHGGSPLLLSDPQNGAPSTFGPGGAGGAAGADSSGTGAGGGGGGGGGSGAPGWPGGAGGAGGDGGQGSNNADANAAPGAAGAQGTGPGAGGGGGGGGGTRSAAMSGEDGGAGATGRAGAVVLTYVTIT